MPSRQRHCQPEAASDLAEGDDCRCVCGNLIARLVEDAVELKCRRCKRILRVPLSNPSAMTEAELSVVVRAARR